jgi:hypothetical protein
LAGRLCNCAGKRAQNQQASASRNDKRSHVRVRHVVPLQKRKDNNAANCVLCVF